MKTALFSALAFGACASVALAAPASTVADTKNGAIAEAHGAGLITLTEAEMDKVTAGISPNFTKITYSTNSSTNRHEGKTNVSYSFGVVMGF